MIDDTNDTRVLKILEREEKNSSQITLLISVRFINSFSNLY